MLQIAGIGVAVLVVVWVVVSRPSHPAAAANAPIDNSMASTTSPPPTIDLTPETADGPIPNDGEQPSDATAPPPAQETVAPTPAQTETLNNEADDDRADQIADKQQRSIERALDEGKTERWSADGQSGYVLVSEPQAYADKTCRNVTITTFSGQDQQQAPAVMWCQPSQGGDWMAAQ